MRERVGEDRGGWRQGERERERERAVEKQKTFCSRRPTVLQHRRKDDNAIKLKIQALFEMPRCLYYSITPAKYRFGQLFHTRGSAFGLNFKNKRATPGCGRAGQSGIWLVLLNIDMNCIIYIYIYII